MLSHREKTLRLGYEFGDGVVAALSLLAAAQIRCSDILATVSFLEPSSLAQDLYLSSAIAGVASARALRWNGAYSYDGFQAVSPSLGKLGCCELIVFFHARNIRDHRVRGIYEGAAGGLPAHQRAAEGGLSEGPSSKS